MTESRPPGILLRLYDHPWKLATVCFALSLGGATAMAFLGGFAQTGGSFLTFHPIWLILAFGAQLFAFPAYTIAYRSLAGTTGGPLLPLHLAGQVVSAGFGGFAIGGGFHVDSQALQGFTGSRRQAAVLVLGLGALEYAILAPAATVSSIVLVVNGSNVTGGLTWPWIIAVPAGLLVALWASTPKRREWVRGEGAMRTTLGDMLDGIDVLRVIARQPIRYAGAWVGQAAYWTAEIAAFYAALRAFGLDLSVPALILAYATGYAATRRTLPLGGAGITEVLLTLSLHWVGLPIHRAIPAVLLYRFFNLVVPMFPAIHSHSLVRPLMRAALAEVEEKVEEKVEGTEDDDARKRPSPEGTASPTWS